LIKSKKLSQIKEISHGFFNRNGGVSKGIYKSLNCGTGSLDSKIDVIKNIEIVKKKISEKCKKIFLLKQIHSNKFYFIKRGLEKNNFIGDALITNKKNIGIAVLTADCAPILIYDKDKKIISAIHAGWRGAYKGIVKRVVKFLFKKGCKAENLTAVIGPCIAQRSYEVKKNFKNKFLKKNLNNKIFFRNIKNKTYFSLNKYIYYELKKLGLKNLEILNKDTFNSKNNFFSARKSIQKKEDDYGRNISIIMIN